MACSVTGGFFALLISLLLPNIAGADVITETLAGQELLFQRNYPAALQLFAEIEREYPGSPAGSFGQMAAWQTMMFENLDFRFRTEYENVEKRFEKAMAKMLEGAPSDWDLFMAGSGCGMRGFYYMRDGKWFRALGSAIRAMQLLKRALWQNPKFVDSYLGLGMYDYWRSVLTKSINFLPFFGDKRAVGIAKVERVLKEGRYGAQLAEANLAFVYANEKQCARSRQIVDKFLARYPNNIILRQLSGKLYFINRKYDDAAAEYKKILEIDPKMTKSLYYIGTVLANKHGPRKAEAADYFNDYLSTNPEKEWAKAAKKAIGHGAN